MSAVHDAWLAVLVEVLQALGGAHRDAHPRLPPQHVGLVCAAKQGATEGSSRLRASQGAMQASRTPEASQPDAKHKSVGR